MGHVWRGNLRDNAMALNLYGRASLRPCQSDGYSVCHAAVHLHLCRDILGEQVRVFRTVRLSRSG